jgi:4-amino-4-deoxy-L-arabinose transferase-like glycosyltransferase
MSRSRFSVRPSLAVLAGLLLANLAILLTQVAWLRLLAGAALVFVLPGWAWLQAFHWFRTRRVVERLALLGGLSAAISSVALLGAVYWPGPWSLAGALVALDLAVLLGVGAGFYTGPQSGSRAREWPPAKIGLALLAILGLAIFLRWYHLGYAEFHEDALENMRLAMRAMAGEEYAPFLDSKGPVHWLLPGSLWLMHGWLTEGLARLPFAVCSTLVVLAVYALGERMAGPLVGVLGSGFVALNGFFVAYARHVENPSLIVLWGVLAAWCAYRFYREGSGSLLILAGLFLGIGLVTHPDVLLYLPPFGFMLLLAYRHGQASWRATWKPLLAGGLVFVVLTLAFYMPFVRDPNFQHTQEYLAGERIGTQILYNRVGNLLEQDRLYSTRYYAPLLILFSGVIVARELRRWRRWGTALAALLALAAIATVGLPAAWQWGAISLAFVPYAILFGVIALAPHISFEFKSLALWFGIPFLALQFLARDAADHIQIAYPAWSLLAAMGLAQVWSWLSLRSNETPPRQAGFPATGFILRWAAKGALLVVLAGAAGLILAYQRLEFVGPVTDYFRAETDARDNPASIYNVLYGGLPRPRKLFGNPRLAGWKAVGYLYDTGQLKGDFRSINESFAVPIWYTHQTPRSCYEDPQNYFVRVDSRGEPDEMAQLPATGYGLTRVVRVERQPMLYIFEKGVPAADEPAIYDAEDYRARYDRSATVERYVQGPSPEHPLDLVLGGKLRLLGYDISATRLAPGETLAVSLYWQALAPMDVRYRAFVHIESDRMWGQHDDDPVCRVRTDEWRPPQSGMGQFRVTLDPGTPPGSYPVTVGVYNPDDWGRLEIVDPQGESRGDVLELTTIRVE